MHNGCAGSRENRVDKGGVEEASKKECLEDMVNDIVFATRLAYLNLRGVTKDAQTADFVREFEEKPHKEICRILE